MHQAAVRQVWDLQHMDYWQSFVCEIYLVIIGLICICTYGNVNICLLGIIGTGMQYGGAIRESKQQTRKNPKRAQRDAKKQTLEMGIGTKSQQALKLKQEKNKQERKVRSREQRDAESQRLFELKQIKKREKHRGH